MGNTPVKKPGKGAPRLPKLPSEVVAHSKELGCSLDFKTLDFKLPGYSHTLCRREYLVHTPTLDIDRNGDPVPLVMCFHGTDETITDTELIVQEDSRVSWLQLSDKEHFLLVYPQSQRFEADDDIPVSWRPMGDHLRSSWKPGLEDEVFIMELLSQLQRDYNINPRKVYALGYSNGGLFLAGLLLESGRFFGVFAAVCNYMGGVDPDQLQNIGLRPEKVSHHCEEPCVSLIGLCNRSKPTGEGDVASSRTDLHVPTDQGDNVVSTECDSNALILKTVFKHSCSMPRDITNPAMDLAVSDKPPVYIVTGSRDSNRNYCYTALCAFKELNYEVFFDDLLHKGHEYQSQSTSDIWSFFNMYTRT